MVRIETVKGDVYLEQCLVRAWYDAKKEKYFAQPHGEFGITHEITPECFSDLATLGE